MVLLVLIILMLLYGEKHGKQNKLQWMVKRLQHVPGDMKGNPDLKWETTISRNLGVDFGFFNNWVRGSLDYYWNTTKNILMKVPIDAASGYSYQFQNVGIKPQ